VHCLVGQDSRRELKKKWLWHLLHRWAVGTRGQGAPCFCKVSQPYMTRREGTDYAHHILLATPDFQTFLRLCIGVRTEVRSGGVSCQVTTEKLMDRVKGWAMTLGFIQNSEVFCQKLQSFPPFLSSLLLLRSYDLFIAHQKNS